MARPLLKSLALALIALSLPLAAFATATVQSMSGDVRANGKPITQDQRFYPGTALTTGSDGQLVLRFDDGQRVLLNQNTEFRIVDFRFNKDNAAENRGVFDFIRGALRVVTGAVGRTNPSAFQVRSPQATIGVRGTDFMLTISNQMYTSVIQGSIGVTNSAGTVVYSAGQFGVVPGAGTLGTTIPASALPPGVTSTFSTMGAVPGVGAGAAGASTAGGAASGSAVAGTSTGGAALGVGATAAAVAAGAAAAASNNNQTTTTPTHH